MTSHPEASSLKPPRCVSSSCRNNLATLILPDSPPSTTSISTSTIVSSSRPRPRDDSSALAKANRSKEELMNKDTAGATRASPAVVTPTKKKNPHHDLSPCLDTSDDDGDCKSVATAKPITTARWPKRRRIEPKIFTPSVGNDEDRGHEAPDAGRSPTPQENGGRGRGVTTNTGIPALMPANGPFLVSQWNADRELVATHKSIFEAAKVVGGREGYIRKCCHGETFQHKGFLWTYGREMPSEERFEAFHFGLRGYKSKRRARENQPKEPVLKKMASVRVGGLWKDGQYIGDHRSHQSVGQGGQRSRVVSQWNVKRERVATFRSVAEAAKAATISESCIRRCCYGETRKCKGFLWVYGRKTPSKKRFEAFERGLRNEPERRAQEQAAMRGNITRAVDQWKDGKYLQTFSSQVQAARACNICRKRISECCRGARDMAGGFVWKFTDETSRRTPTVRPSDTSDDEGDRKPAAKPTTQWPKRSKAIPKNTSGSSLQSKSKARLSRSDIGKLCPVKASPKGLVSQWNLKRQLVSTFGSAAEAAKAVNTYEKHIRRCCNGEMRHSKGFLWVYGRETPPRKRFEALEWALTCHPDRRATEDHPCQPVVVGKQARAVDQWKDGKYIQTFPSQTLAAASVRVSCSGISRCCHGNKEAAGGFVWRFAGETSPETAAKKASSQNTVAVAQGRNKAAPSKRRSVCVEVIDVLDESSDDDDDDDDSKHEVIPETRLARQDDPEVIDMVDVSSEDEYDRKPSALDVGNLQKEQVETIHAWLKEDVIDPYGLQTDVALKQSFVQDTARALVNAGFCTVDSIMLDPRTPRLLEKIDIPYIHKCELEDKWRTERGRRTLT